MAVETFEKLVALFKEGQAEFRVLEHASARTSQEVAQIRGTEMGQGAKAMVCRVKISASQRVYVHVVLPADQQVDFEKVAAAVNGKKASLATPDEAQGLTGCVMGSVPPVSFNDDVELIVDPALAVRYDEIAFNAGLLDRSIVIKTKDYVRIVAPRMVAVAKSAAQ